VVLLVLKLCGHEGSVRRLELWLLHLVLLHWRLDRLLDEGMGLLQMLHVVRLADRLATSKRISLEGSLTRNLGLYLLHLELLWLLLLEVDHAVVLAHVEVLLLLDMPVLLLKQLVMRLGRLVVDCDWLGRGSVRAGLAVLWLQAERLG